MVMRTKVPTLESESEGCSLLTETHVDGVSRPEGYASITKPSIPSMIRRSSVSIQDKQIFGFSKAWAPNPKLKFLVTSHKAAKCLLTVENFRLQHRSVLLSIITTRSTHCSIRNIRMRTFSLLAICCSLLSTFMISHAFVVPIQRIVQPQQHSPQIPPPPAVLPRRPFSSSRLSMVDLVTYLRTEWVSAALCTNQTPRVADVCLQLGTEDGRAVTFVPRTIREIITSSAEADGQIPIAARRQLKQQADRRQSGVQIKYLDQRCDNLDQTPDESVDVVLSLQAAHRMQKNGVDWKKSIREAARVLKRGGRLLFVEKTEIDGESYLDYVQNLYNLNGTVPENLDEEENDDASDPVAPIFELGWDEVDLVLEPHVAGVAIKSDLAGLTPQELARKKSKEEEERLADLSIEAYERGRKKRKKKRNASKTEETKTSSTVVGKK